jgi:hypothetical protein
MGGWVGEREGGSMVLALLCSKSKGGKITLSFTLKRKRFFYIHEVFTWKKI